MSAVAMAAPGGEHAALFCNGTAETELPARLAAIVARVNNVGAELEAALRDRRLSTIANRVAASQYVVNLVTDYSVCVRAMALHGIASKERCIYDLLRTKMEGVLSSFFSAWVTKIDSIDDAAAECAELRRIVAEVRVRLQVLDTNDPRTQITQTVWKLASAKCSDRVRRELLDTALRELHVDRLNPGTGKLAAAASALSLHLNLLAAGENKAAYIETNVVRPMLNLLRGSYRNHKKGDNLDAFLTSADNLITADVARVAAVLGADLAPQLLVRTKREAQQALLSDHALAIVKDTNQGVAAQLQYPELNARRFQQLFNVLDFSKEAVAIMRSEVSRAVVDAAKRLPTPLTVESVVQLRGAFSDLLATISGEHRLDFHIALQSALTSFLADDGFELQLALHFDYLIKSKPADAAAQLARAAQALPLVKDGAAFLLHFRTLLSSRLTMRTQQHLTTEGHALQCLSAHYGSRATQPMRVMLREAQAQQPQLRICNDLLWPSGSAAAAASELATARNPALAAALDAFAVETRAIAAKANIVITPDLSMSTAEVALDFPGCEHSCLVFGSVPQLLVLEAVAAAAPREISADDVTTIVVGGAGAPTSEMLDGRRRRAMPDVVLLLKTLVSARLLLPTTDGLRYAFNSRYMDGAVAKKKVVLPTVGITRTKH